MTAAKEAELPVSDLHDIDFTTLDSLILSPGVPLTHPEPHWTVEKAKAAGIEIIGDTEVFQREVAGTGARHRGHHRHQWQIHHDGADRPSLSSRRAAMSMSAAISALRCF